MTRIATPPVQGEAIRLPDGRRLGYAQYGDPDGLPVFYFHGTPGSRLERPPDPAMKASSGMRLLVAERPGYGLSDFHPRRSLLDWPDDVTALAEALELERFAVLGVSGGGPHAAACAYRIPERLTGVALVSSLAPVRRPGGMAGLPLVMRLAFTVGRIVPGLLRPLIWCFSHPGRNPRSFVRQGARRLGPSDRAVLARPEVESLLAQDFAEAARQGVRGYAQDVKLFSRPWGFPLEGIGVPVYLWHGGDDRLTPPHMGRYLAGTIPGAQATFLEGEGHFLVLDHLEEIASSLVAASRP